MDRRRCLETERQTSWSCVMRPHLCVAVCEKWKRLRTRDLWRYLITILRQRNYRLYGDKWAFLWRWVASDSKRWKSWRGKIHAKFYVLHPARDPRDPSEPLLRKERFYRRSGADKSLICAGAEKSFCPPGPRPWILRMLTARNQMLGVVVSKRQCGNRPMYSEEKCC